MEKVFSRYDWKPKLYKTAKEIEEALEKFCIKEKVIKTVHAIGYSHSMEKHDITMFARRIAAEAGVPYEIFDAGKYQYSDYIKLPFCIRLLEPVVFVFEDFSTLEICPHEEGLLMAVNQIPADTVDGLNFSNLDSEKLFRPLEGQKIGRASILIDNTKHDPWDVERSYTTYYFETKEADVFFKSSGDSWFEFGLKRRHRADINISLKEMLEVAVDRKQIPIIDGHDGGGYFYIYPFLREEEHSFRLAKNEISIEEGDLYSFLRYFLYKYFDENVPYDELCPYRCCNGFDGYDSNFYSYQTMERMLSEIEQMNELLKTDFDNPSLSPLKRSFSVYDFEPALLYKREKPTNAETERIIRENVFVATEFYDRFTTIIRRIMKAEPNAEFINFDGP